MAVAEDNKLASMEKDLIAARNKMRDAQEAERGALRGQAELQGHLDKLQGAEAAAAAAAVSAGEANARIKFLEGELAKAGKEITRLTELSEAALNVAHGLQVLLNKAK